MNVNPTLPQITQQLAGANPEQVKKSAQEFEAFYIYQVLELMTPEVSKDNILGNSFGEKMFRQTMNEEVAKAMSKSGGIGITDAILGAVIQQQEVK